jgi:hypothetical protein
MPNRKQLKKCVVRPKNAADFSEIAEQSAVIRKKVEKLLKRCGLISSVLLFVSRVARGMPSLAAAQNLGRKSGEIYIPRRLQRT